MWELLQKLENLGWKPYGKNLAELSETEKHVRLLTSASSGLWQYVCENGMANIKYCYRICYDGDKHLDKVCFDDDYQYRLIKSALTDESELESFILDNIKIGE